eukprot:Gb_03572 [translate_table: standard]
MALPSHFSKMRFYILIIPHTAEYKCFSTHDLKSLPTRTSQQESEATSAFGIYDLLLQSCGSIKSLAEGNQFHAHVIVNGFEQNVFLVNKLVSTYAICGSLVDARLVFDKIPKRNVLLWNAIISGYVKNGICEEALKLYDQMLREGVQPDKFTFPSVLKACADVSALRQGKEIHDYIIKSGYESDVFVVNGVVNLYAKCGSVDIARHVFDKMSLRNAVSWNAMISGYTQNGYGEEALNLFRKMQMQEVKPDIVTITIVLPALGQLAAVQLGKEIHAYVLRTGFEAGTVMLNALIDMYAKCRNTENAQRVFDKMPLRDVGSWNAMLACYAQNGDSNEAMKLFYRMEQEGIQPDSVTIVSVLSACAHLAALQTGKTIHAIILRSRLDSHVLVLNALTDMYAKCGNVEIACLVFNKCSSRDLVSWNTMISGYAQNGLGEEALNLFREMQLEDVKPDIVTIASLLPALAQLAVLQLGKEIHNYVIRTLFDRGILILNALIDMYSKCGSLENAKRVFDKMTQREVGSWNTLIACYVRNGHWKEALNLFHRMEQAGIQPDSITIVTVLPACAYLASLQVGKKIHGCIVRSGLESHVSVCNALIDMYGKCRSIDIARQVFDNMSPQDVVSWNVIIAGYFHNGHWDEALNLFRQMKYAGSVPDSVSMATILPICSRLGALNHGKEIHNYIIRSGFEPDVCMDNALIDMYAKCGSLKSACLVFGKMSKRDLLSWSAMIAGYGMHGHGEEALALFCQMEQVGVKPDHITFIAVLSACSHAGLVDEGWLYFNRMRRLYHIIPRLDHYTCIVDLLGRAGQLEEAYNVIRTMPLEPDAGVLGALLSACRVHSNVEIGEQVAEQLFELEPANIGYYILLSSIYAVGGRWDGVAKIRTRMKERGLKKCPGCSWIEVKTKFYAFFAGDTSHPQSE